MSSGLLPRIRETVPPSNTQHLPFNLTSVQYRNFDLHSEPRDILNVNEHELNRRKYQARHVAAIPPDIDARSDSSSRDGFIHAYSSSLQDYSYSDCERMNVSEAQSNLRFLKSELYDRKAHVPIPVRNLPTFDRAWCQSRAKISTQSGLMRTYVPLPPSRFPRSISEHHGLSNGASGNGVLGGVQPATATTTTAQQPGDRTSGASDSSSGAFSAHDAQTNLRSKVKAVPRKATAAAPSKSSQPLDSSVDNHVYMQHQPPPSTVHKLACDSAIDIDSDDDDVIEEFNRLHREGEYDDESLDSRDRSGRDSEEAVSLSASSSSASYLYRDSIRECLERDPSERSNDDVEMLVDFLSRLPAFANLAQSVRLQLCSVLVFVSMSDAGTVVLHDGEELDSWSVIINGSVDIFHLDGSCHELNVGDCFGVEATSEKYYHHGEMRTRVADCQFVCVAQADYQRILNQGEETCQRITKNGRTVLILEDRSVGDRVDKVAVKGTPEMLINHLIEGEHSLEYSVDTSYTEDFLLTYRMFLSNPGIIAERLLASFNEPALKDKVIRIVLMWVNNHFIDFEAHPMMMNFLEQFTMAMEASNKSGQLKLLYVTSAAKARLRTVTLTRSQREETLNFSVLGGWDRGFGVYICHVEENSRAEQVGLRRGDQIMKVNGVPFEHIEHEKALSVLRGATMLIITVQSNLFGFREMLTNPADDARHRHRHRKNIASEMNNMALDGSTIDDPMFRKNADVVEIVDTRSKGSGFMTMGSNRSRLKRALKKMLPKTGSTAAADIDNEIVNGNVILVSSNPDPESQGRLYHSRSNPDLVNACNGNVADKIQVKIEQSKKKLPPRASAPADELRSSPTDSGKPGSPDQVIKVFRSDQSFKYLFVHRETSAREIVMLALSEFGVSEPSQNFSLCQVSAEGASDSATETNIITKQRRLPDTMQSLAESIPLNARFYLKNNNSANPSESQLMSDDISRLVFTESITHFLDLNAFELAVQLTLQDYSTFSKIEPTDYIDELCNSKTAEQSLTVKKSGESCSNALQEFMELVNREMFWVVSEVCREKKSAASRAKIIKHFIKLAKHCHDLRNFNSCFAIVSGLSHRCVIRLRQTWERLPVKYRRVYETLESLMDPSRNMSKYRQLVAKFNNTPPLIPFYPIVGKDLTFLNDGNSTFEVVDDGPEFVNQPLKLVNFEKLRMIGREVRLLRTYGSVMYNLEEMFSAGCANNNGRTMAALASLNSTTVGLGRKQATKSLPSRRRNAQREMGLSARKMFEDGQMVRRVKQYLTKLEVVKDEEKLTNWSQRCEGGGSSAQNSDEKSKKDSKSNQPERRRQRVFLADDNTENTNPTITRTVPERPKFGQQSQQHVQKLLSLSEKAKPHHAPKLPTSFPPNIHRSNGNAPNGRPIAVAQPVLTRINTQDLHKHSNGHPVMLRHLVPPQSGRHVQQKILYNHYRDEYPDNSHAHYHLMPVVPAKAHPIHLVQRSYLPAESSSISPFSSRLLRAQHSPPSVISTESASDSGLCLSHDSNSNPSNSDSPSSMHHASPISPDEYSSSTLTNRRSRHSKKLAPEVEQSQTTISSTSSKRSQSASHVKRGKHNTDKSISNGKSAISAV